MAAKAEGESTEGEQSRIRGNPRHMGKTRVPNYVAVALLMFVNLLMTIGQVNTASVYSLIGSAYGESVYGLGLVTAAFSLAYGVFEMPGGVLATKFGPKRLVAAGTLLNSVSVAASAVAPTFTSFVAFRFMAGMGFSLAFPSILVLVVRNFRAGSEGVGTSMMFVSASIGLILGFTPSVLLAEAIGWRQSLLISGLLGLTSGGGLVFLIPSDSPDERFKLTLSHLRSVIFDRPLLMIGIAALGFGALVGVALNFTTYYLETQLHLGITLSSEVTEIGVVLPILSSPMTGRVFDVFRRPRALVLIAAAVCALGVGLMGLLSLPAAIAGVVVTGLGGGMSSVGLIVAREIAARHPEYESLTIAWVDSFALYGGFVAPIYFSRFVVSYGYSTAWIVSAVIGFTFALPFITKWGTDGVNTKA